MKKILLATHGYMARGLRSALEIVTSDVSGLLEINAFTPDCENPEEEVRALLERYPDEDDLLVLTDVYFGSVNQIFLRQMRERNIRLVTGINLPLAVELLSSVGERLSDEDIEQAVELCRAEMRFVRREDALAVGEAGGADDGDEEL